RISQLLEETALLKEQLKTFKGQQLKGLAEELSKRAEKSILMEVVEVDPSDLGDLAEELIRTLQSGLVALAMQLAGRVQMGIRVSPDLVKKGISAGAIVKEISPLIGGSGGGRPDMAQAGGKTPE